MRPLILVLNSNNPSRLPHLRKIYSLRNKFRFCLITDYRSDNSWAESFFEHSMKINITNLDSIISDLVTRIEEIESPSCIINLSEFCVPLHAYLSSYFNLPGPTLKSAKISRDKSEMRKLFQELNIPSPKSLLISSDNIEEVKKLTFPIVLKPRNGGGATLVRRFNDFAELKRLFGTLQNEAKQLYSNDSLSQSLNGSIFLAEELIEGNTLFETQFPYEVGEISVESIFSNNTTQILAIHDKPIPSSGPYFEKFILSTPSRIPFTLQEKAIEYVDKIHRGLKCATSVLHTEFKTQKDNVIPIEFGMRLGGGPIYSSILRSTGVDFIEVLIELGLGLQPNITAKQNIPTITHYLWAPKSGIIKTIVGETIATRSPQYLEHLIYDDIGTKVYRAPLSYRANGHVIFQCDSGFDELEKSLIYCLDNFHIEVEENKITNHKFNRQ